MRETQLLGRILFSLIFLVAGFGHFSDATIQYAASQGVPYAALTVPFSGLLAIVGGLSILFGYQAKWGAWALVLFLVPVTLKMHAFWTFTDPESYQLQLTMFLKNLAMLGGALTFASFGAGAYSLDARERTDEREAVGASPTGYAASVTPTPLRTESQAEVAAKVAATQANDSSRLTGMW